MQASNHVNPYQVLNISPDASIADIKKRYHELILECHPDKVNASSDVAFKERVLQQYLQIQASWSLLSDPQQRQRFDAQLAAREQVHYKVMIDLFSYSEADGLYRMSCRCSDELSFAEDDIPDDDTAQIIIQCPGCSLRYEVILDEQVDDPC